MTERTVDMWRYLPPFLKQFRELDKLIEAETPEFQALLHSQLQMLDDLFIETAHEEGLKKYEELLNIYPDPDDSIETRRQNVFAHWYSHDVYTLKVLRNRLVMLQGDDNIQLSWNEDDNFLLEVVTRLEKKGQIDNLIQILETMLPANVAYDSQNRLEINQEITFVFVMGLSFTGTLFNTNDIAETVEKEIPVNIASGISITGTFEDFVESE